MGWKSEQYYKGYSEGKIFAEIDMMSRVLKSTNEETKEEVDELIRDGVFTEYDRQQALFYIRLGIRTHKKRKRRRK